MITEPESGHQSPDPLDVPSLALDDLPVDLQPDFAPLTETQGDRKDVQASGDPYHHDSLLAQEAFQRAADAVGRGDEAEAVQQYLVASKLAEMAHEWYLAAICFHRVGDFLQHPKPPSDLERAFRMYRRAIAAYEQSGYFDEAHRLSYRITWLKLRRARALGLGRFRRAELFAYWLLAGFGYRPLRVLCCAMTVVVLFGAAYWELNGVVAARDFGRPLNFWDCVYFSGTTFTTLGYGDLMPGPGARLLALAESTLGMFTMGFLVVVFANRLRH
jgi:hypothetical protein